jgi:hypothetical protein
MCFVFKSAVVFLCKERLRQKKKTLIVSLILFAQFFPQKTEKGRGNAGFQMTKKAYEEEYLYVPVPVNCRKADM